MTVHELIVVLQKYPPTAPVVAEWDSGLTNVDDVEHRTDNSANFIVVLDVSDYNSYGEPH